MITFNDLKDYSKLPVGAYYTEPRDLHQIFVVAGDTFDTLVDKVIEYRKSKDYPSLPYNDLRVLVITSLERSIHDVRVLTEYFEQRNVNPKFQQVFQVAKLLCLQIGQGAAGYNLREERASKCLGCALHRRSGKINEYISKAIDLTLNAISKKEEETVQDLHYADLEKGLGTCNMCGCGLLKKVRVNLMPILASLQPNQLDRLFNIYGSQAFDKCWMLNEALRDQTTVSILEKKLSRTVTKGNKFLQEYRFNKSRTTHNGKN